jgi:hypothetical protein
MKYKINANFYDDLVEILKKELLSIGFAVKPNEEKRNICLWYFNLRKRLVMPVPRIVLISKEFSCPPDLNDGLKMIKEKIVKGQNITPHLSRRISAQKITNLDYDDAFLNDWGIHHLHLGTVIKDDGFIDRTDLLLFARFDNKYAYFINVMPHGSWTKQQLIKILYDNWPVSIEMYRLKGVLGLERKISDDDYKALRGSNVSTAVEIGEGIVYGSIGGGYTTSGLSVEVLMASDYFTKLVHKLEEDLRSNKNNVIDLFEKENVTLENELEFHLAIKNGEYFAIEKHSMKELNLRTMYNS